MIWLRSDKNDFPNKNPTKKNFCFLVPWNLISRGVEKTLISCSRPAFSNSEVILITRSILLSFSQAQWQGNQSIFIPICDLRVQWRWWKELQRWEFFQATQWLKKTQVWKQNGNRASLNFEGTMTHKKHFSCSALFVRVRSTISFPTLKCNIAVFYSANNGSIFMSSLQIRSLCAATKWKQ